MTLFIIFLFVLVIVILFIFGLSLYAYYETFYVCKKKSKDISKLSNGQFTDDELEMIFKLMKEFKDDSYEEVSIKAFDGIKLNARYYEYNENAPVQIMFHGYRSESTRDFAGGMKLAKEAKHNILLIEQRGHGNSEKNTTTLGVLEKYDCLYWVNYVVNRFGKEVKIILTGVSMGAATVLMATSLKLPSNVVCVIADSPYSSPYDIISKVLKDRKMPKKIIMPFIKFGALVFGGFKLEKNGAVDAVKENTIPVLIIHGASDSFVPTYMSKEIYYNCTSKKELHIFENAEHCRNYLIDENRYASILFKFIGNII